MGPALQRLLTRPSSLKLLQCLVERPQDFWPTTTKTPISLRPRPCCRHSSSAAVFIQGRANSENIHSNGAEPLPQIHSPSNATLPLVQNSRSGSVNNQLCYSNLDYGQWKESSWTRDEIEFESNLDEKGSKLLDRPAHRTDIRLWACLFDYRQRTHGLSGVTMFWTAVKRGDFEVPVTGAYAQRFWDEFVNLGLQNDDVLNEVCLYADQVLELTDKRWPKLYVKIVQYMLVNDRGNDAIRWHNRLFELHPPGPNSFAEMVRQVIFRQGDMRALKEIYKRNNHCKVYGKVVPFLCEQEDFKSALQWHYIFIRKGDLPATSKKAEPLVHFLAIYDRPKAVQVTRSLVDAGVPFASSITSTLADNATISREMMNLIHGETLNLPAKAYNDKLGARWFATRWVSLDVAMTAISALGVKEIGPLSLQAISLREQDAEGITRRINQLGDLDISIGNSVFSRSVEEFARTKNQAYLNGLLQSDQHPDSLEDPKLQDRLLGSYARSQDWIRYRMTLAVRLIGSKHPELESKNIILRSQINAGDTSTLLASLQKMQIDGAIVTANTINTILHGLLRPRQPGRRPITSPIKKADDLKMVIGILKGIMESGSFVSTTNWREIIKRLGMLGRWKELEDLCIFLASWYGPANTAVSLDSTARRRVHQYRVPAQVRTSHPLHPLRILFPSSLQRAIVEWGFIHALRSTHTATEPRGLIHKVKPPPPVTSGITLLKRLHEYRVHIDAPSVNKAIFHRLVTYYGPGQSDKLYNRRARENNTLSLAEMAAQIDKALGRRTFLSPNLREVIDARGNLRLQKRAQKVAGRVNRPGHGFPSLSD